MTDSRVRIGPAGWSYKDWDVIVYPAPKPRAFDPLTYLAGYFDTVEVNSTFYRPATDAAARAWLERAAAGERAPDRFRFTTKLWQRFTHQRDAAFTPADVYAVRRGFDVLAESGRLGAVLVQFPWSFKRDDASREWLDDVTRGFGRAEPGGAGYPLVLKVRHASWNVPAFYRGLAARGVGFVNVDQPLFAKSLGPSATATAPVGYVRLHRRNSEDWWREDAGVEARYGYLYSAEELARWAERARGRGGGAGGVRDDQQPLPRAGDYERGDARNHGHGRTCGGAPGRSGGVPRRARRIRGRRTAAWSSRIARNCPRPRATPHVMYVVALATAVVGASRRRLGGDGPYGLRAAEKVRRLV